MTVYMSYFYIQEVAREPTVKAAGAALLNNIYKDLSLCQSTRWPSNKHATFIFFRVIWSLVDPL